MDKMTTQELLDDTIKYYSEDPVRRGIMRNANDEVDCVYTTDDGKHCAVGRWLKPEYQDTGWWGNEENGIGELVDEDVWEEVIRGEVIHIPMWLWYDLQSLHDIKGNWDYKNLCLTEQGTERLMKIQSKIDKENNNVDLY